MVGVGDHGGEKQVARKSPVNAINHRPNNDAGVEVIELSDDSYSDDEVVVIPTPDPVSSQGNNGAREDMLMQNSRGPAKHPEPDSSSESENNEQNQGGYAASNPEASVLSEQSSSDQSTRSSKRKKAGPSRFTIKAETTEEPKSKKQVTGQKRPPVLGDRVYARWPENQNYYWGNIEAINTKGPYPTYNILFDDGDLGQKIARKWVHLAEECEAKGLPVVKGENRQLGQGRSKQQQSPTESKTEQNSQRELGDEDLGIRCYAEHTRGSWYWGTLTMLCGTGPDTLCTVLFDDGEELSGIRRYDQLYTEDEHSENKTDISSIAESYQKDRCKSCSFCQKEDCGKCKSCKNNAQSSTTRKCACLFKICIYAKDRELPIPHFPPGWTFYFEDNKINNNITLHPKLGSLWVKNKEEPSKTYINVRNAGRAARLTLHATKMAEEGVYKELLGLDIRNPKSHPLVGKDWCREWIDSKGHRKIVYGKVSNCEEDYFAKGELIFTIKTIENSVSHMSAAPGLNGIPKSFVLDEGNTKGGVLLCMEKIGAVPGDLGSSLPKKWYVPDTIKSEHLPADNDSNGFRRPRKVLTFRGTKLEFEARKSSIPNAGLGCFIRCTSLTSSIRHHFRLECGEWLDFGCYAPIIPADSKDVCVQVLKNFLFDSEPERWSFDHLTTSSIDQSKVFDITHDDTGTLHTMARYNLPPYVNETDGIELPSVRAEHSPEGSVHYVLGHSDRSEGPLSLPTNVWLELKIDYGEGYEPVRIKEGYSRLPSEEVARMERKHGRENDMQDTLRDIFHWSIDEIDKCIQYLSGRCFQESSQPASRALIAAIAFYLSLKKRVKEFEHLQDDEYCDNGWSTMEEKGLIPQCRKIVGKLMKLWENELEGFTNAVLANNATTFIVGQLLGLEKKALEAMHGRKLRKLIREKMGFPTVSSESDFNELLLVE